MENASAMVIPVGVDSSVWAAGGLSAIVAAIAVPLWKAFIAKQATATDTAIGEANWIKRLVDDNKNKDRIIDELIKLRETDNIMIQSLKLSSAMADERHDRDVENQKRMGIRMLRLERALIEVKPELEQWITSGPAPLGLDDKTP